MSIDPTPGELAAHYWNAPDTVAAFSGLAPQPYLLELIRSMPPEGTALDLGCGAGRNTLALLERGFTVVAVDLHAGMVEVTRARSAAYGTQVVVRQGAAHAVDAADGAFSLVVCYGVLHNCVDRAQFEAAVAEIARILAPGGLLALNCFTSQVLDPALTPAGDGRHLLPGGVPMTLLPAAEVLGAFAAHGVEPLGEVHEYVRQLDVGPRSVLRCVMTPKGGPGV